MKKKLLFILLVIVSFVLVYNFSTQESEVEKLRKKHATFLNNHPYNQTMLLSKKERKTQSLPPNAFFEQKYLDEIDPNTGRTHPENLIKIQEDLKNQRTLNRVPGDASDNAWLDRGPNNIGGRTRGIMFDPNDATNKRVFAGGVSGGLWKNEDITDSNSSWTLVPNIGANISVVSIISDPNNSNTFYIGSGESYTNGDAVGRGVWKSTDAGVTWSNIFGGPDGTITNGGQVVNGVFYINDIVARDLGTTTELYITVGGAFYKSSPGTNNFNGLNDQGVYKSVDGGTNWTKFTINESNGSPSNPNDLEIDINNNIWFTTTRSSFGFDGGKIYRSTDGITFSLVRTIADARRTEIEVSSTDANKLWIANHSIAGGVNGVDIFYTDDAFATISALNEPNDVDNGISATDYTRGQAFYDLPIEVDANDNLYVGGIDLFRSTDNGNSWTQISKWSNNNNLAALDVSLVHADHHAIIFRPGIGNENNIVFGNDGGVYYSNDITLASGDATSSSNITSRNKDYNVVQFYYGAMGPTAGDDDFIGGTQDNGTLVAQNAGAGANSFDNFYAFFSGDGSYSDIDQNGGLPGRGEYQIVGSTGLRYYFADLPATAAATGYSIIVDAGQGDFINQADLDDIGNILYADASFTSGGTTTNQIARFELGINSATRTNLTNALLDGEPSAFKVSPFSNTTLLVGTNNNKLLRLDNANSFTTWNNISGASFVGNISDIEFGQTDQEIFVTIHNYGVTNIWFTNDGGTTWVSKEGDLPDLPVKCILQNPLLPKELIIGTDLGVWTTSDYTIASPVWTQSYNGMSDVTVLDLDVRPSDNTILASTHGRGMFTGQFTAAVASVDDVLAGKKEFTIYPTVSNGNFTIFGKNELGKTKMNVFDISGRQVYTSNLDFNSNERQEISVNLNSGVYIVNLVDENNKKSSNKIVIE